MSRNVPRPESPANMVFSLAIDVYEVCEAGLNLLKASELADKRVANGQASSALSWAADRADDADNLVTSGIGKYIVAPNGMPAAAWLAQLQIDLHEVCDGRLLKAATATDHGVAQKAMLARVRSTCDRLHGAYEHLEGVRQSLAAADDVLMQPPALQATPYLKILKIIHDTGLAIERHPRDYQGKVEEALRDHLLTVLSSHFQSVTGETVNKAGKTDILVRQDGKNLFVAECAVWNGPKNLLGKIDQLLSYLTWRDSNTALICFVKKKEIASVIAAVKKALPTHACFVKEQSAAGKDWLPYEFSLPGDKGILVSLALMCFHVP